MNRTPRVTFEYPDCLGGLFVVLVLFSMLFSGVLLKTWPSPGERQYLVDSSHGKATGIHWERP